MFYFLLNLMNCSHKNCNVYISFSSFSPCCAGNVPLSLFLSKMKQAKKEAIHRSISSIIQIHLSTVRSNIVVYILPKVSKGIVRLFCFKTEFALFGMCSFWSFFDFTHFECPLLGMCFITNGSFWNVLFLDYHQNRMYPFWNVPFLEFTLFGMCPFWNVFFLNGNKMKWDQNGMC